MEHAAAHPSASDTASVAAGKASGWVSTEKGAHLRGRKTKNTKPEVELRKAVHALGLRFRLHRQLVGRCSPDLTFYRWRLAVFVDGCFWHGCPEHSPAEFKGPNAAKWREKIDTNRMRDRRNESLLHAAGWRVLRIWECEIKQDVAAAAKRLEAVAKTPLQQRVSAS